MIVIGIDPGTATTGFGIVKKEGNSFLCLDYGVITTCKKETPASRLCSLNKELSLIIKKHSPNFLAIESVYFFKNLKTVLPVSQAKGIIMFTAEKAKIPIYEFTPLEVKMTITGYGRADKKQVQEMVKLSLNLDKIPQPDDAADALGIAICGILKKTSFLD